MNAAVRTTKRDLNRYDRANDLGDEDRSQHQAQDFRQFYSHSSTVALPALKGLRENMWRV